MKVDDMKTLEKIREPLNIELTCTSKVKKWAFDNAYMLIFISVFFTITWILSVVLKYAA
jgi:hypothetical protein